MKWTRVLKSHAMSVKHNTTFHDVHRPHFLSLTLKHMHTHTLFEEEPMISLVFSSLAELARNKGG